MVWAWLLPARPARGELNSYRRTLAPGVTSEDLAAADVRKRWPQWHVEDDVVALFQEDGGILDMRRAGAVHIALARQRGVEFLPKTTVTALDSTETHVTVHTNAGTFIAESVVICAASWASTLLPALGIDWKIALSQEQVSYFATPNVRDFAADRFPVWIWHGEPLFYGCPIYGEVAVKIARDISGRWVTVDTRSYDPIEEETQLLKAFLHADLAIDGHSRHPIRPFRADRPALTDANFPPSFRLEG